MSDILSSLAVAHSLKFSIISDTLNGSMIIHDFYFPSSPLWETKDWDGFETDTSFDDHSGILLSQRIHGGAFIWGAYVIELSEITHPVELVHSIHFESSLDVAPNLP